MLFWFSPIFLLVFICGVRFDLVEISFGSVGHRAVFFGAEGTEFDLIWWRSPFGSVDKSGCLRCRSYGVRFDLVEISFGSVDRAVVFRAEGTGFDLIQWRSPLDQLIERLSSVQKLRGWDLIWWRSHVDQMPDQLSSVQRVWVQFDLV